MFRRTKKYIKYALCFYIIWRAFVFIAAMANFEWWVYPHYPASILLVIILNIVSFHFGKEEGYIIGHMEGYSDGYHGCKEDYKIRLQWGKS